MPRSLRSMMRQNGFWGTVLCLALGLGGSATLAVFLDQFLLRPPHGVVEADSVRRLSFHYRGIDNGAGMGALQDERSSYPILRHLGREIPGAQSWGAIHRLKLSAGRGAAARQRAGALVTAGFFSTLGVRPALGRFFSEEEAEAAAPSFTVVLSHEIWKSDFDGSPSALGRTLILGVDAFTVIGVAPSRFTGDSLERVDLWLPANAAGPLRVRSDWRDPGAAWLAGVVRLAPGVSPAEVGRRASPLFRRIRPADGWLEPMGVSLRPLPRGWGPDESSQVRFSLLLWGLSGLVLLIACANAASFLGLRAFARRQELAIRQALGAGRAAVGFLVLCDGLWLVGLAGLGALAVEEAGRPLLAALFVPVETTSTGPLDGRNLVGLVALALATFVLSSLGPAWRASSRDLAPTIQAGGSRGGSTAARGLSALLLFQVALSLVLLLGAGLFARSLHRVLLLDLGFDEDRVLVADLDLARVDIPPGAPSDELYRQGAETLRRLPGVEAAAIGTGVPFLSLLAQGVAVPGWDEVPQLPGGGPFFQAVSEDYFRTLGIAVRKGRGFTAADGAGAARVAVVNVTMAERLWPGADPLGRCIRPGGTDAACATLVGVVDDTRRQALREAAALQYYIPLAQTSETWPRALFARVRGNPRAALPAVQQSLQALDPRLPFVRVVTLAERLDPHRRVWKQGALVLTLFAGLAGLLAVFGIHGATSRTVARREHELAIRAAIGASPASLVWLVLRRELAVVGAGAVLGLTLALLAGSYVQPLLFDTSGRDPAVFLGAPLALVAAAAFAGWWPGRRAARLAPAAMARNGA